jgi:hypothetical protein
MMMYNSPNDRDNKTTDTDAVTAMVIVILAVLGVLVGAFLLIYIRAWILVKLWGWYIVPFLHIADLNLPTAFGLSLIIPYVWHRPESKKLEKEQWIGILIQPVFTLFLGWLGTFFM